MILLLSALLIAAITIQPGLALATPEAAMRSVVSVLPVWPNRPQGGVGQRRATAPEGSGIVVRPGVIATAWHVIEPAERIDVRLADGRVLAARSIGHDAATDIALLAVETDAPPIQYGASPGLASAACAIGNAYGLGLSITCGVVSARHVTDAGFNPIEDFVQTDAAANPGVSGGALVDPAGRLIGMMSAVFASGADTNIGINFAVSMELLERVVEALLKDGQVSYVDPGWRLQRPDRDQLTRPAAPVVTAVVPDGPAALAGIVPGDQITTIGERRIRTPRDAIGALALVAPRGPVTLVGLGRDSTERTVELAFSTSPRKLTRSERTADCPHPVGVCAARQAVFPISAFDPVASATRIGPDLLVANRHALADRMTATVHTPLGPREGTVVVSEYDGDLVVLQVDGLPGDGIVFALDGGIRTGDLFVVGADIAREEIHVFAPGRLISDPAPGAELGRLHVTSRMLPGLSGGALVDAEGQLVGIAVGGGDGRFEAIPLKQVRLLLDRRGVDGSMATHRKLGAALAKCVEMVERAKGDRPSQEELEAIAATCKASSNQGQLLAAGRLLARSGAIDGAVELHAAAVDQTPNSINARMSLLVSLQLGARFEDMVPHARWLADAAPDDPRALRFGVQSGVWGGDADLAEAAYRSLVKADPRQAEAARRFIDNAPPAPPRR